MVAGSTFLQIIPPGDLKGGQFNIEFEEGVYKGLEKFVMFLAPVGFLRLEIAPNYIS
jgi:hypothetical protein